MAFRTVQQIEELIGQKITAYRLNQNILQTELANKAGVSLGVLKRLERGEPVRLGTLIRVMKALGLEDWFDTIAPFSTINPLQAVNENPRQRARRKKSTNGR
ncbi:MAG: helix-turn-helix domain-containing protein [Fibrobacteria bacterium]|nr:helix-turn-helix domain-containing protein [Fibrobacteria bacterium]